MTLRCVRSIPTPRDARAATHRRRCRWRSRRFRVFARASRDAIARALRVGDDDAETRAARRLQAVVPFNLGVSLTAEEREAKRNVKLSYEHQGVRGVEAYDTGDFLAYLPPDAGGRGVALAEFLRRGRGVALMDYSRGPGVAATRVRGISTSRPRRRRDSSPRTIHVAAAAESTRADTIR